MKIPATILFVFAAISLILMGAVSLGNVYALKDEDGRYHYSDVRKCQKQRYRSLQHTYMMKIRIKRSKAVLGLLMKLLHK